MKILRHPIPVLLYHAVNDSGLPGSTPVRLFRSHLDWLAGDGWRTLRIEEFEAAIKDAVSKPRRVLITFDDGHSDLELVCSELEQRSFGGVAFLITEFLENTNPGRLDFESARRLAVQGTIEFHSHTHSHRRFGQDEKGDLSADLARSRGWIARLPGCSKDSTAHLAWPWGVSASWMESTALEQGFPWQYSVQRGAALYKNQTLRIPRYPVENCSLRRFSSICRLLSTRAGAILLNQSVALTRTARRKPFYCPGNL